MARRPAHLAVLLGLVATGFTLKYGIPGGVGSWGRHHGAGLVYVVFWVVFAGFCWPSARPAVVAGVVLGATILLEFLQRCQTPWLLSIRATWFGSVLVGTAFDPLDIPYYMAGGVLGGLLLARLARRPA